MPNQRSRFSNFVPFRAGIIIFIAAVFLWFFRIHRHYPTFVVPEFWTYFDTYAYKTFFDPKKSEFKWVPAPIPIYTPAPFHNVLLLNSFNNTCIQKFQNIYPMNLPVMISSRTNAIIRNDGKIKNLRANSIPSNSTLILDEAIYLYHAFPSTYFHFLFEMFMTLLYYDKKTLNSSVIVHTGFMTGLFKELLSILDIQIRKHKTIRSPIFVKLLHISTPTRFCEANPNGILHFKSVILKKLDIENLPATEFVLYNRVGKQNRQIRNFQETLDALGRAFPNINFLTVPESYTSYVEQIKFWRKVKCLATVHCSILTNLVYMHPNTVYIEYTIPMCATAGASLVKTLGIQMYSIQFPRQERNRWLIVEIPALINAIEIAIKFLDSHDLTLV